MQNPDFIPLTFNPRAAAAAAVKKNKPKNLCTNRFTSFLLT